LEIEDENTDRELCEKRNRNRSKKDPPMGEAQKILKLCMRLKVYSIMYMFRGDTARREVETSSGVLKLCNNFRYVQHEAQEKQIHKPENKHFIIPAFQQTLLRE